MDELEVHIIYLIDSRAHNNLFPVISFDPQKYKGMMEKIKLSEVEKGLPNGIIAQIRGLNTQGEGILEPLDSFLSDILCARGSFIYNSQEVIDNLKKPGVYKHGDPIIGTGTSYGAHGVLLVLYIDEYTIQYILIFLQGKTLSL